MPAEPPPFGFAQAREAFDAVAALHSEATLRAVPRLTAADLQEMRAADAACREALTEGRVEDAIDADDRFHDVLTRAADDPDLTVGIELVRPRIRRLDRWYFARITYSDDKSGSFHDEILAACEAGDAEGAAGFVERSFHEGGEAIAAAAQRSR
jgi:DNA-binding GntR family transcriptional regulator